MDDNKHKGEDMMMNIEGLRGAAKVAAQGARRRAEAVGEALDAAVDAVEAAWKAAQEAGPGELGLAGLAYFRAYRYCLERLRESRDLPTWHRPESRQPNGVPDAACVGIWADYTGRVRLMPVHGSGSGNRYAGPMTREALTRLDVPVPGPLLGAGGDVLDEQGWLALVELGV